MNQGHLCMECWCHIFLFHKFRNSVLRVHDELVETEKQVQFPDELLMNNTSKSHKSNGYYTGSNGNGLCIKKEIPDDISQPDLHLMDVYKFSEFNPNSNGRLSTLLTGNNAREPNYVLGPPPIREREEDIINIISEDSDYSNDNMDNEGFDDSLDSSNQRNLSIRQQFKIENVRYGDDQLLFDSSEFYNVGYNSDNDMPQSDLTTRNESDTIISMWLPTLPCSVCNEQFSSFSALKEHFRLNHDPSAEFFINCCERKFNFRCQLTNHIRKHLDPKAFKCQICGRRFSSKSYLKCHKCVPRIGNHSGQNDSDQGTSNSKVTASRIQKCHDMDATIAKWKPTLQCAVCLRTYTSFSMLHVHFRHKHPNDSFYIICCRRKFSRRCKLVDHINLHLDPSCFQCDVCGKNLATKDALNSHKHRQHGNTGNENSSKDTSENTTK